jgi:hypothetical protein
MAPRTPPDANGPGAVNPPAGAASGSRKGEALWPADAATNAIAVVTSAIETPADRYIVSRPQGMWRGLPGLLGRDGIFRNSGAQERKTVSGAMPVQHRIHFCAKSRKVTPGERRMVASPGWRRGP